MRFSTALIPPSILICGRCAKGVAQAVGGHLTGRQGDSQELPTDDLSKRRNCSSRGQYRDQHRDRRLPQTCGGCASIHHLPQRLRVALKIDSEKHPCTSSFCRARGGGLTPVSRFRKEISQDARSTLLGQTPTQRLSPPSAPSWSSSVREIVQRA